MNFCKFSARNPMSFPARSCNRKVTPPDVPTPGIAGGGNAKAIPSVKPASSLFPQLDCLVLFLRFLSLLPRLQGDEEEGAISILNDAKKAEPDDSRSVFDARYLAENIFDFTRRLIRAIERRGVR